MTINEELSTLRGLIKEMTDDSKYTDSFLFSLLKRARGVVLKNNSKKNISKWNWHRFCVELEEAVNHNCGCIPQGCSAMVSVNKIPRALSTYNKDYIEAMTLGGDTVGFIREQDLDADNLDEVKKNKLRASVYNDYLYVWNTNSLKYIQLNGVWEDITEWEDVKACGTVNDGSNTANVNCISTYDLDIGMGAAESHSVMQLVLRDMGFPLARKDDDNANRNPEIRA